MLDLHVAQQEALETVEPCLGPCDLLGDQLQGEEVVVVHALGAALHQVVFPQGEAP